MANSAPELRQELLDAVGVDRRRGAVRADPRRPSAARAARPAAGARRRSATAPPPARHAARRTSTASRRSRFLGGGCWQHHVPAVCDEIAAAHRVPHVRVGHARLRPRPQPGVVRVRQPARRAARAGLRRPARLQLGLRRRPRDPHGRAHHRRSEVLVPANLDPERARGHPHLLRAAGDGRATSTIVEVAIDARPAALDLDRSASASSATNTAAVYFETPDYLGVIETDAPSRSRSSRTSAGAETIVGVDPISLGVLAPPGQLRRRHRGRLDPAARRAHELRRRRRRLHRLARRGALRARVPDAARSASPRRRTRASTASG